MSQPVRQPFVAVSDASGNATFSCGSPAAGTRWTVTIQIPLAPSTASTQLAISGLVVGSFSGPGPYGPVQIHSPESLTLTVSGLTPSTSYTAVLTGILDKGESGFFPVGAIPSVVDIGPGATVDINGPVTVETAAGVPVANLPVAPESIISFEGGAPAATLIAGVAGKTIYLHHVAYTIQSPDTSLTSPGVIQGSNAGAVICYVNPSVPGQVIPLGGYALAVGEGLNWLANSFPAGVQAYVTITYTIA